MEGDDSLQGKAAAFIRASLKKWDQAGIADRVAGIVRSDIFKAKIFRPEFLKKANKFLLALVIILAACLVAQLTLVRPREAIRKSLASPSAVRDHAYASVAADLTDKSFASQLSSLSGRTIFGRVSAQAAPKEMAPDDLSANLGLVGVIPGDSPQAIIENKKTQKVYYVRRGGSFENFVVTDIKSDKVVIDYDGKTIELFL